MSFLRLRIFIRVFYGQKMVFRPHSHLLHETDQTSIIRLQYDFGWTILNRTVWHICPKHVASRDERGVSKLVKRFASDSSQNWILIVEGDLSPGLKSHSIGSIGHDMGNVPGRPKVHGPIDD